MVTSTVNGVRRDLQAPADTPLLYVLRNDLELSGPQFGCGLAQCGACSVLLDGKSIGREEFEIEPGGAGWIAKGTTKLSPQKRLPPAEAERTLHPVQQAWIEEQTPLCGFCQSGMMIKAAELLERVATPTAAEIKEAFTTSGPSPHLCRCGSYTAIMAAVQLASSIMAKGGAR